MKKIYAIPMLFLAVFFLVMPMLMPIFAHADTTEPTETDSIIGGENVQLGISCGTLKGTGAVIVVDKVKNKMYKLPFTCPAFTI